MTRSLVTTRDDTDAVAGNVFRFHIKKNRLDADPVAEKENTTLD